ncbi:hypothetical protein PINS_up004443 [Pythium insidiosum]|nr:hypothetical protein PINS_up004443 [Pythium insidiosum]
MKVLQTLSLVAAISTVATADVCRMSDQSKLEELVMTDEFFVACEELAILNVTPNNVCVKPKCRDFFKKLVDKFPTCVNPDGQTPKSMWENALKKCGDATPTPALRTAAPSTNAPEIEVSPTKLPAATTAAPGTSIPARKTPAPATGSNDKESATSGSDKKDASPVVGGDSPIAAPVATKAAAAKTPAPSPTSAASSPMAVAAMGVVSVVCSMLLL